MKLRIRGNSIRLRLTRSEVEQLTSVGVVEEFVDFGPGNARFIYALESAADVEVISAKYENNRLSVHVPRRAASDWAGSDKVSLESPESSELKILVEKDFACLTPRKGEDETDMFPHPGEPSC